MIYGAVKNPPALFAPKSPKGDYKLQAIKEPPLGNVKSKALIYPLISRNPKMKNKNICIGVDFGTDSVRTLLIDSETVRTCFIRIEYPRWKKGYYCDPVRQFRPHPLDHIEGLLHTIKGW